MMEWPAPLRRRIRDLLAGVATFADAEQKTMSAGDYEMLRGLAQDAHHLETKTAHRRRIKHLLPGRARKEARMAKRKAHKESTAGIRAEVLSRSGGRCEIVGCSLPAFAMDHWLGGSGRRRQQQSVETCWMLCAFHNRQRTDNWPSAQWWNDERRFFCQLHGYPFQPHKELP